MEVYYTFRVTNDDGEVIGTVYGERAEWVIPARPDINVDTVYPGYNEMTVTLDTEPYEVYLESVDGSTVIYDADDGAVDGCIHGLTEPANKKSRGNEVKIGERRGEREEKKGYSKQTAAKASIKKSGSSTAS